MKTSYACSTCGAVVWRTPSHVVGRVFCSRACNHVANTAQPSIWKGVRGASSPGWKGGRTINGRGYARILRPDHPMADSTGYVLEHRFVMAELLGRVLSTYEHVHHVNGIKTDNRPENLVVLDGAAHVSMHQHAQRTRVGWSRGAAACLVCGTTERRHIGQGLCANCYSRARMRAARAAGYIAPSRRKPPVDHVREPSARSTSAHPPS